MRKNILWNLIYGLILLGMLLGAFLAVRAVLQLNMLPQSYVQALGGIFGLFVLLVGVMLFWKGKKAGKGRRIVACVLAILMIGSCAVITTVANDVLKTLNATNSQEDGKAVRAVYVLKDSKVRSLEDTKGFTYGYVKYYDEACTQQVLEEVERKTDGNFSTAGYTNAFLMAKALQEGRIDAMILNGGYLSILEDTEAFSDYSSLVRILAVVEVQEPEETQPTEPKEEILELPEEPDQTEPSQPEIGEVDYESLQPFMVYVSGSDSYDSEIIMNSRSDVNILAAINPRTKQILLVNTPRDYYVENTSGGGKLDKLTHCGLYGTSCSMKTLGNLYHTDISYYVRINFSGFKKLIDALGGVTVYSDYAFTAITRTPIQEGENHLTGQEALDFARERYTLKGGDNERGKHQMQVITAVIEKATDGSTILSNYSDIMASVEGMFSMNIPVEMIGNLMKMQLTDMAKWNIVSYAATGTDAMEECYSVPGMELSVIKPSNASISKAIRLIDMVCEGELLTEEVINSIQ